MTFPTVFAAATTATGAQLDACLNFAALLGSIPTTITGTNALSLTPTAQAGPIAAYQQDMVFAGIIANTNSGSVTANPASLGSINVYRDSTIGPVLLTGGELQAGNLLMLAYDLALNSGAGGFHIINGLSSGGGGGAVSSVNGQAGAVSTSSVAGFLSQAVDVYIEPTGGKSVFINPASAAGQIDNMSIGRTVAFDGSFAGQFKSISPVGSPTGGSLLATLTSLNATSATLSNTQREFLASIGLTNNTGQGVANGNGAKAALFVGTQCAAGTGGHNPGDTRGLHMILQADTATGTYTAQGIELDLINNNAATVMQGVNVTLNASGGASFTYAWGLSTAAGPAACNIGLNFAGGAASPILASGAAIFDGGTTGSTVLQIQGTHTTAIKVPSGAYSSLLQVSGGSFGDALSFTGGGYTRGLAFSGGSYTYCVDTNGASTSGAFRAGNNQGIVGRNGSNSGDVLIAQVTPSNQLNVGDSSALNVLLGTRNSGVVGPQIDNNTQCGVAGLAWGSVSSYSYVTVSDPSLKTAINPLPSAVALLKTIDPISYALKDDAAGEEKWGFDAQNVHEAFVGAGFSAGHVKQAVPPRDAAGEPDPEGEQRTLHAYSTNALVAALWRQNQELLQRLEALEEGMRMPPLRELS